MHSSSEMIQRVTGWCATQRRRRYRSVTLLASLATPTTMAHDGDMQIPQSVARFNRRVTNPIQRLWAGRAPTFGILEHVGRKSGTTFRTPLTVFTTADGFAILLTY